MLGVGHVGVFGGRACGGSPVQTPNDMQVIKTEMI